MMDFTIMHCMKTFEHIANRFIPVEILNLEKLLGILSIITYLSPTH